MPKLGQFNQQKKAVQQEATHGRHGPSKTRKRRGHKGKAPTHTGLRSTNVQYTNETSRRKICPPKAEGHNKNATDCARERERKRGRESRAAQLHRIVIASCLPPLPAALPNPRARFPTVRWPPSRRRRSRTRRLRRGARPRPPPPRPRPSEEGAGRVPPGGC